MEMPQKQPEPGRVWRNSLAASYRHKPSPLDLSPDAVLTLHKTLPAYAAAPLHELDAALVTSAVFSGSRFEQESVPRVFVKDEAARFGARSFKILGASVAVHYAVCAHLQLDAGSTSYQQVAAALAQRRSEGRQIQIVTCTDGNWGAAVARSAALYLDASGETDPTQPAPLSVTIFLPRAVDERVADRLRAAGSHVTLVRIGGNYDDAIDAARRHTDGVNGWTGSHLDRGGVLFGGVGKEEGATTSSAAALLLLDTSFRGYAAVPGWVTAGYATSLCEVDAQLRALGAPAPALAVCSVGVGSWAQSVVAHFCSASRAARASIVTVEPVAAPSLQTALAAGQITTIATGGTIMEGMNCGTTSALAWPVLAAGVRWSVTVSDGEAHAAVELLGRPGAAAATVYNVESSDDGSDDKTPRAMTAGEQQTKDTTIQAGPCGAAPLAALKRLAQEGSLKHLTSEDAVILFSSEGRREYNIPV